GSYAATMGLAAMGPKNRDKTQPWIPLALAAKTTADAAQAAKLTYDQFAKHKAACMWCLIAAAATLVSAALAVPEAREAMSESHSPPCIHHNRGKIYFAKPYFSNRVLVIGDSPIQRSGDSKSRVRSTTLPMLLY